MHSYSILSAVNAHKSVSHSFASITNCHCCSSSMMTLFVSLLVIKTDGERRRLMFDFRVCSLIITGKKGPRVREHGKDTSREGTSVRRRIFPIRKHIRPEYPILCSERCPFAGTHKGRGKKHGENHFGENMKVPRRV